MIWLCKSATSDRVCERARVREMIESFAKKSSLSRESVIDCVWKIVIDQEQHWRWRRRWPWHQKQAAQQKLGVSSDRSRELPIINIMWIAQLCIYTYHTITHKRKFPFQICYIPIVRRALAFTEHSSLFACVRSLFIVQYHKRFFFVNSKKNKYFFLYILFVSLARSALSN